jgi:hypothetical protein
MAPRGWSTLNPYVDWALGPGRVHYFRRGEDGPLPLLVRLKGGTAQQFLDGSLSEGRKLGQGWRDSFRVVCRQTEPGLGSSGSVWAAALADDRVQHTIVTAGRPFLESATLARPLGGASYRALAAVAKAASRPPRQGASRRRASRTAPSAVVMGVIDDGIAFAHERFRTQHSGTRVEFCWLQDSGIILTKAGIDALIATSGGDEDMLYRKSGLTDFREPGHKSAAWRVAHGTHVMDLACGFDPAENRDDRPIVAVQLPVRVTADENPCDLYLWISLAIDYIVDRAKAISYARASDLLPVVINLSYGLLADPHDGTGALEAFIGDKIAECRAEGFDLRVVLPAGNSYLSRIHGQLAFTGIGQTKTLHWRVLPDDRTPSFLEIWLPAPQPAQSRLTLAITSPTGASMTLDEFGAASLGTPHGDYAWAYWTPWQPSNRARFTIILQSTAHPDPATPVAQLAPAGTWRLDLTHSGELRPSDLVQAWVRRDDHIYGFPLRGRQSFLDDIHYRRFDHAGRNEEFDNALSPVRRESTINSMATGDTAIVIGGYLGKERRPANYSAAGARRPPPRRPDAMAVSEDSFVHAGVLAAGSRSGSVVAFGGTSVAAPQVARRVADLLAAGQAGDRAEVQALATIVLPQPERSGAGGIPAQPIVRLRRYD